jgi:hypothetical protein
MNKMEDSKEMYGTDEIKKISDGDFTPSAPKDKEAKVDFPFDLDTLMTFNFNCGFDVLKFSIEYLSR